MADRTTQGSLTCKRPDRDIEGTRFDRGGSVCGYPLPCPWHTAIADLSTGEVTVPKTVYKRGRVWRRVREVTEALRDG